MPKVPTADGFNVLPGVRQGQARPVLSMDAATLPGRQMARAGEQMSAVGKALGDYALKEQEKINRARLNDAYNQGQKLQQDLAARMSELKGASAAKGIDGRPIGEYFAEELNKGLSGIAQDLGNDVLKQDFGLLADDMVTRFRGQAMAYEAEQSVVYQDNVDDDTTITAFNVIANDPLNPDVTSGEVARAKKALDNKFRRAGFDERSGLDERVKSEMGKFHGTMIDTLLDQNRGVDAKKYFEKHRNDFNAVDAEMVEAKVSKGASASQALVDVDAVLDEFKDKIVGENYPIYQMQSRLREIVGDEDTVRLEAGRRELEWRMKVRDQEYKNQYADNYDTALRLAQSSPARAYASSAFLALDAKDQEAIRSFITGKADKARSDREDAAYYDIVNAAGGPQAIASMADGDFRMLRPKVGESNFVQLQKMRADMQKDPTKVIEVALDNDQFNVLTAEFGYDVTKKGADKAEISRLRVAMDNAIDAEQQRVGRKLSRQEKEQVVREAFSRQVLLREGVFRSRAVPVPMLSTEDIARIKIPAADRQRAAELMAVAYDFYKQDPMYAPTEENLRRFYAQEMGADVGR